MIAETHLAMAQLMTTLMGHMTPEQVEAAASDVRDLAATESSDRAKQKLMVSTAEAWEQYARERRDEGSDAVRPHD
jgi:hypothetical protein